MSPFLMYAGYEADRSYRPLNCLTWNEEEAPKSERGVPLAQHCDIHDPLLMKQVVNAADRPWKIGSVKEMWVSTMPGTKLSGKTAKRVFDLVNSWQRT